MEDRETPRMRKYGESKTTRIMMATVRHVTSSSGLRKFQADGFFFDCVYLKRKSWWIDGRNIFQGKLNNQDQMNTEFDLEEFDFNVTNHDVTEPIYLEVRNIILKFKHQKAPGIYGVTAVILQKVSPPLCKCIHNLNKTLWNKDEIQAEGMGNV